MESFQVLPLGRSNGKSAFGIFREVKSIKIKPVGIHRDPVKHITEESKWPTAFTRFSEFEIDFKDIPADGLQEIRNHVRRMIINRK